MKQDILIKGIPASHGIAIGKAFLYKENKLEIVEKSTLSKEEEIERLVKGREIAKSQLEEIKENTLKKLGKDKADIFEGHITLLEDEELFSEIDSKISQKKCTAEFALNEAIDEYATMLANLEDAYFKERAGDLRDIGKRWLYGVMNIQVADLSKLEPETIIVSGSNFERSTTCAFMTPYSHLFPISLKSPALSLKYASSKFASIFAYSSIASLKANSAVHFFSEIFESISENNSSSSNKVICPSKISALSLPSF